LFVNPPKEYTFTPTTIFLKPGEYHLNNLGRLDPALLFSATNYTKFTNFLFFFVLIREIRG